ncbi:MAG: FHA domain-containing protein [Spirochaetota bacterium]
MKLMYTILTSLLIFSSLSNTNAKAILEQLDTSEYPKIQLHVREDVLKNRSRPIQAENMQINEIYDKKTRSVRKINIVRSHGFRNVHFMLAVNTSEFKRQNQKSRKLASDLLRSLDAKDDITLLIYSDKVVFLETNLSKKEALDTIAKYSPSTGNRQKPNLLELVKKTKDSFYPSIIININQGLPSILDRDNDSLIDISQKSKTPIFIFGENSNSNEHLSQETGGKLFPNKKKASVTALKAELYNFRKIPPILSFESSFSEKTLNLFLYEKFGVQIQIGENNYNLKYKASYLHVLRSKYAKMELFYPGALVLLLFCIFVLFVINATIRRDLEKKRQQQQQDVLKNDLYYQENIREEAGLSHSNALKNNAIQVYQHPKEEDKPTSKTAMLNRSELEYQNSMAHEELSTGNRFETGILIQKKGPNPGRQFIINQNEIRIGSNPENELVLWDSFINSVHAKIKKIDDKFVLFDMYSNSGVYLNGKKLLRPKTLTDFDEIKLGKTILIFRGK